MGDHAVADDLKGYFGADIPDRVAATHDPFDVLRYASTIGAEAAVDVRLKHRELDAIETAPITPGAASAMHSLVESGRTVSIVSNNSADAIRVFLGMHDLSQLVHYISARVHPDPGLLKPNPYLLEQAVEALDTTPDQCAMVGDSVSDIEAAHAAGTAAIAYADEPGKHQQFQAHALEAIIDHMSELMSG